jgi:hypothetical protein
VRGVLTKAVRRNKGRGGLGRQLEGGSTRSAVSRAAALSVASSWGTD